MQILINCHTRTLFLSSLTPFSLLIIYLIWPWCYAAWFWRNSTIEFYSGPLVNQTPSHVPLIIHQTWRDQTTIPLSWQQASNSCRTQHSNYQYRFWTDRDARLLIEKEFPCLLSTYDAYPYDIQRADVIRLIVLYVYGGIYLDLDIVCLKSLDYLRQYDFVLPRTMPAGLSNDFIIATPKHPFLLQVLNDLPKFNRRFFTKYSTVMFSTGPVFLTHEASLYSNRSTIHVLSPGLYGKYAFNASQSLFRHLKASSWHGKDAAFIKWIYQRRMFFLLLTTTLFILTFALICLIRYLQTLGQLFQEISFLGKCPFPRRSYKYDKFRWISV